MPSLETALSHLEAALASLDAARREMPAHAHRAAGLGATQATVEARARVVEAVRMTKAWIEEQEAEP